MFSFSSKIFIIGVNPYVLIPQKILKEIFKQAGKDKGPTPVRGKINDHAFTQTLVKYSGKWRLYLNSPVRKGANADVGDVVNVAIEFNPTPAQISMPEKLKEALEKNKKAAATFSKLPPSRQKEIM